MSTPTKGAHKAHYIHPCDQLLVFVVRKDGEPGLFVADGVTADQASKLLAMMAEAVKAEAVKDDPRFRVRPA